MSADGDHGAVAAAAHRRRLAEVFGDVLDTTSDEREPDERAGEVTDAWLRAQVPPHHG